ncbi:glycyl-radical enzyme activating protein [Collinsella sp. An2]|uniref:(2S)-3-sulfopropanediol dehydratase activating enzyme n=1 Tax=Collinsella sp. An2 TaxID=1965585 RepID=UPI000B3944EE|nr:glycyl-radical enzyme activating protein [Collinsella sp. An2]OUP08639.1 glycyl-radical enzyme activating protein [Collinsella sp. An2]
MTCSGIVFNVQRYTIHDGPGLRTEFFLKGCPLHCRWCSNPESWNPNIQYGVYRSKCIGRDKCGACIDVCEHPEGLIFKKDKLDRIDYSLVPDCKPLYDECPSDCLKQWGREMTVDECMKTVMADKDYYEQSGGGVTVSGGEPLLQSEFVAKLFEACHKEGVQTCCETTFHVGWDAIERVLPVTDIFITDIKTMDTEVHKEYIGAGNEVILDHIKRVVDAGADLIVRIPVIPGVNDDEKNISATADFILNELGNRIQILQLLSFMRLGVEKYQSLGMPYGMRGIKVERKAFQKHVEDIAEYFASRGIRCRVGSNDEK